MNILSYFKAVNAQRQINKLERKYKNKKVVIYGAGEYFQILKNNFDLSKLNVVGIADKKFENSKASNPTPYLALAPEELKDFDFDVIGKELKKVLEACYYSDKTGDIKVTILLKPSYTPKASIQPKVKKSPIVERKSKKYICYYEERINGELVDDFKEWCTAYSEDEAREYFKDNYRHNPNIQISMIVEG